MYGGEPYIRSAEDIAFHVALFIAPMNGSYVNYYMVCMSFDPIYIDVIIITIYIYLIINLIDIINLHACM